MPKIKSKNLSAEEQLMKMMSDELSKSIDKHIMETLGTMVTSSRKIKMGRIIIKLDEMEYNNMVHEL